MSDTDHLWQGLWARLFEGLRTPSAPGRTLGLASQRKDGGGAVRMVVLRDVDRATACLTFYTNAGSQKIVELSEQPKAEVLLWDAATSFQARLCVTVTLDRGTPALWDGLSGGARLNYAPAPPPGSPVDAPYVPKVSGPEAFVVLTARIVSADILDLSELPHRRARFEARDAFTGQWLAP